MSKNYSKQNLQGRSFRNRNLQGADFSDCDVRGCDFSGADLTNAKFCRATMGKAWKWNLVVIFLGLLLGVLAGIFSISNAVFDF